MIYIDSSGRTMYLTEEKEVWNQFACPYCSTTGTTGFYSNNKHQWLKCKECKSEWVPTDSDRKELYLIDSKLIMSQKGYKLL